MTIRDQLEPNGEAWDAAAGRSASRERLQACLDRAPAAFLEGAAVNPELTAEAMAQLIRNRHAPPALLARIGRDRRWTAHYAVRRALVRNPRTPYAVGRRLLAHLFWKDLAEAAEDRRLHPALRRHAERLVCERLEELTLGERIALARRASRTVIEALRARAESPVLRTLLENRNLRERDAIAMAQGEEASGEVLARLAEHPKWGGHRGVRLALTRNRRTPVAVALRLVAVLPMEDLERLARDAEAPRIVRVAAQRRLDARSAG